MTRLLATAVLLFGTLGLAEGIRDPKKPLADEIGFDQHLAQSLPQDLAFRDEQGKPVRLAQYFGRGPVVLALVYFSCPSLCSMVLNGLFRTLQELKFTAGREFQGVVVSIDPKENSELAQAKKENYLSKYVGTPWRQGLHFLTGDAPSIEALAKAVGFRYRYDPISKIYAHPGGIVVLTGAGQISQYLFGVDYPVKDLRLALVAASNGKIGSFMDHFLLFCYRYDPTVGKYGLLIFNVLRISGLLCLLGLLAYIISALRGERRARAQRAKVIHA